MQKLIAWAAVFLGLVVLSLKAAGESNKSPMSNSGNSGIPTTGISGQVDIEKDVRKIVSPDGVLFVFARATGDMMPLVAMVKIPNPKFPVTFTITDNDRIDIGPPLTGPYNIRSCYSPSGQVCRSFETTSDPKHPLAYVGQKDIKILLKSPKPLHN